MGEAMKKAVLQRMESSDEGTFGVLTFGTLVLFTGELPWRDNDNNFSCIPAGKYKCILTMSPRFKRKLYLVGPVDDRFGIRIHPANFVGDVKKGFVSQMHGCISLGEKLGWIKKQKAVLLSQPAVRRLMTATKSEAFELEVKDARAS